MSALRSVRKPKNAPYFTTSEYVDIDIDPGELEAAGWVYVGSDQGEDAPLPTQTVLDVVVAWHYDSHDGPWKWCHEEPCDTLRGRPHDGRDS